MNAFGEALNLVFMRWSWWFSSGSMPMEWISDCIPWAQVPIPCQWIQDCIPMSSYSQANESQNASHEFLSYSCESQNASPWIPIPLPMNLWMLEFKSLFPANESLDAFPWVPIPLPNFGVFWLGTTHVLSSWFKHAPRIPSVASRTRFWVYPLQSHMGTPKIDLRAF